MKKLLILSIFPAPYRVNVFNALKAKYDITLFFERIHDNNRSTDWFVKNDNIHFEVLSKNNINYRKVIKEINQFDAILVYDYTSINSFLLMLICMHKEMKYFLNCDGAIPNKRFIQGLIKTFFIKRATGCFANGKSGNDYFKRYGAKEERIFHHDFTSLFEKDILLQPIDDLTKQNLKLKYGIENKKTVISVGRFIYMKGFDVLLDAWEKVNANYNLIIIGGGDKKDEYLRFIEKKKMNNVRIIDFMPFDQIMEYYRACDLFVLPTREDIWGLVINEAMASGLPVITTDKCVAGLELIDDGKEGFIVSVENRDMLSKRINEILENDARRNYMAKSALVKIKNYTIENIAESHIRALDKLI